MKGLPQVTVVVPVRDATAPLDPCLDALRNQDYPSNLLEIVVVAGASADDIGHRVASAAAARPGVHWEVLDGPGEISGNLNAGLGVARGDMVFRVDAKSRVPRDYVRRCVETLRAGPGRVVVGGSAVALDDDTGTWSIPIARAYNNRVTMGLARYRRRRSSGPTDTVYLGAFDAHVLRSVGGWDERLRVNQDYDLNQRLARAGVVWFDAGIRVGWEHGSRTLGDVWHRHRRLGRGKATYWAVTGATPSIRQVAALVGPPALVLVGAMAVASGSGVVRRAVGSAALAAFGLLAVEVIGSDEPRATRARDHVLATLAIVVTAGGWWTGVVEGLAASRRRSP